MVVEVLSPSTRKHDLDNKLPVYQAMPSLEHILIIEQSRPAVTHHSRSGAAWTMRQHDAPGGVVALDSLGRIPVAGADLSRHRLLAGLDCLATVSGRIAPAQITR